MMTDERIEAAVLGAIERVLGYPPASGAWATKLQIEVATAMRRLVEEAVREEREACAAMLDEMQRVFEASRQEAYSDAQYERFHGRADACETAALRIRQREGK